MDATTCHMYVLTHYPIMHNLPYVLAYYPVVHREVMYVEADLKTVYAGVLPIYAKCKKGRHHCCLPLCYK
jgi:hypothetical protein